LPAWFCYVDAAEWRGHKNDGRLGGWDSVTLPMETYAHAMPKAKLTDNLFDTAPKLTHQKKVSRKIKEVSK
jgi:hypothetical protein